MTPAGAAAALNKSFVAINRKGKRTSPKPIDLSALSQDRSVADANKARASQVWRGPLTSQPMSASSPLTYEEVRY